MKTSTLFALILIVGLSLASASQESEIVAFEEVGEHSWEVPDNVDEVTVLVVAGGGSGDGGIGGDWWGSGGGGGEVILQANKSLRNDSYSIKVGDGGVAPTDSGPNSPPSEDGEDSYFGDLTANGGQGGQETEGGGSGSGNLGGVVEAGTEPDRGGAGGGGQTENGSDMPVGEYGGGDGGDGAFQQEVNGKTYNFSDIFGTSYGESINGEIWFGGGGPGFDGDEAGFGKPGKGGGGAEEGYASGDNEKRYSEVTDGEPNTGGGGAERRENGDGGKGGSGIVLIRYESDFSICDRRGPFNECISNSTHKISGESFDLDSIFESESTSVFEAFEDKASIRVSNSTSLSGLWQGSFEIGSEGGDLRIKSGAEFRPGEGSIRVS